MKSGEDGRFGPTFAARARMAPAAGPMDAQALRAFTIVELVVGIVVVGLLAAVAASRFVDLGGEAHEAAATRSRDAFRGGVALVHSGWIARGASSAVDSVAVEGATLIGVSDSGWPENTLAAGGDGLVTAAECASLWTGLLQSAPSISTSAGGADWLASAPGASLCQYDYAAAAGQSFTYDVATGIVAEGGAGAGASDDAVLAPAADALAPDVVPADDPAVKAVSATDPPTGKEAQKAPADGASKACGLLGIEPVIVLWLVRRRRHAGRVA